jgi:hypothetical protein
VRETEIRARGFFQQHKTGFGNLRNPTSKSPELTQQR